MPRQLSAATIRARIRALETQARKLERRATKGLRAAASIIAKHALSLSDLKQAFSMSKGKSARRRNALAGRPVPVKYRDDKGNKWSGRGRPPLWLVAAEKAGKRRESFLVGPKKVKPRSAKPKSKAVRKASKKPVSKTALAQSTG
jgi:DNA-binding protein H-NS